MTQPQKRIHDQASPTASGMRRAVGFGNYRLFARLGSGGMADVYLAVARGAMNVNRLVVIKRLRDEHTNDPTIREMFLNEARLAARLNHANVIQTFEAGSEGGSYFLAMEYVDGQPLSRVLAKLKRIGKALDPRFAARVCADALSALHYAHELTDFDGSALQIVHRDVSPQNIMIAYEGAVKLVDFGIAKAAGSTQTAHGVFKGKVAFMAPEQVRGDGVDRRADIFAAGIVLWECVTGEALMAESTPAATLYNLLDKPIRRASAVNPDVPAALDDIIDRALQRDVEQRFQTAKEMRDALEAFIAAAGSVSREEIGELTKSLFADTREKVQTQIRSRLANLSLARTTESGRHPAVDLADAEVRAMASGLGQLDDGWVDTASADLRSSRRRGLARVAKVAWFGIPLLALAGSGLALRRAQDHAAPPAVTATANAPSAPPPPAPADPAPAAKHAAEAKAATAAGPATGTVDAATATTAARTAAPTPQPAHAAAPARPAATPAPASAAAPPLAVPHSTASAAPRAPATPEPARGRTFRRDL